MSSGIETHFKRQAAVWPAAIQDQRPNGSSFFVTTAITVWVRKRRTVNEPATARTSDRPYDGSSWAGLGRGSPTARAPHCLQPLLKAPTNLKPQHGQIVTFLPQKNDLRYPCFSGNADLTNDIGFCIRIS